MCKLVLALPHCLHLSASEFAATLLLAVTDPAGGTFSEISGTISLSIIGPKCKMLRCTL